MYSRSPNVFWVVAAHLPRGFSAVCLMTLVFTLFSDAALAGEINSCKFLIVQDFVSDPYGIAAEFRLQAGGQGFTVESSFSSVPPNDRLKACVMTGSWSASIGRGYVAMRVTDWSGALVAESSVSVPARISVGRTVRNAVSKVYSQLGYTGFDDRLFVERLERKYPPRPTIAITEETIKNSDPVGVAGIWTDTDNRYRLGIIPASSSSGTDYQAVVLQSNSPFWKSGEIKAEIRSTASSNVFTCTYYMQDKTPIGTTLTLEQNSLLRGSPVNYGNQPYTVLLIRVWPKAIDPVSKVEQLPKSVSAGTGFLITHGGLVVTNWHVVADAKNITVSFPSWSAPVTADLVVKDKVNDLAVLRVSDASRLRGVCNDLPFQLTSSGAVTLGERVSTIGYPLTDMLGSNPKFAEGVISGKSGFQDDPRWLQISAQVQPGSSGSPLFDPDGNIVGVVIAKLDDAKVFQSANTIPQNVNFAIKSDYLLSLLSMVGGEPLATRTISFSPEKASQCVAIIDAW